MFSELIAVNGMPLQDVAKARVGSEGKARIVGLSPWKQTIVQGMGYNGATLKSSAWRDYYDMYRQHTIVRAAVEKIAKTATAVGYDFVPRNSRSTIQDNELTVLRDFFDGQPDFMAELSKIYKNLCIYGDAYLYVIPDRRRRPTRLKSLSPKTIQIKANRNGVIDAYYQADPDRVDDDPVTFQPHEILHFKISDPDNDLYGLSPLESLKSAVAQDLYAQRFNAAFFRNSAVTGTIISINSADPAEIERNRKWLKENYNGPDDAHKPLVIQGDVKVMSAVKSHAEMGFLEGRKFIIMEILAVLDVPPAKLGMMESANRSNSKEQDKTFRSEAIDPLQRLVESVINDHFVRTILGVQHTKWVHSESDTRDALDSAQLHTRYMAFGVETINEVRDTMGKPHIDGGDTAFIMTPTGAVPVDRMDLYFQLPQTNTDKVPVTADDPPKGEPTPKGTRNRVPASSGASTSKAVSLSGALGWMAKATTDDASLYQAYAYLKDAATSGDQRVIAAADALRKACETDDLFLRRGYILRATGFAESIIPSPVAVYQELVDKDLARDAWSMPEYDHDIEGDVDEDDIE